jgi:hypothetical protein
VLLFAWQAQAMQGTEEKPKSSLLQNMEMGNAAFWDSNGEAGSAAPNGTADSDQQQASPADAGQPAAQPQAPAMSEWSAGCKQMACPAEGMHPW